MQPSLVKTVYKVYQQISNNAAFLGPTVWTKEGCIVVTKIIYLKNIEESFAKTQNQEESFAKTQNQGVFFHC